VGLARLVVGEGRAEVGVLDTAPQDDPERVLRPGDPFQRGPFLIIRGSGIGLVRTPR
jgi:hypothetical protein